MPVGGLAVGDFDDRQRAAEVLLPEHHQTVLVRQAERTQKHGLHGGKHRRRRAERDGKQEGRNRREPPIPPDRPQRLAQ